MQKLKRLMENRPPRDVLPKRDVAGRRNKPPLYYYGFPFTRDYAVGYIRRHALTLEIAEEEREAFDGKEVFNFRRYVDNGSIYEMFLTELLVNIGCGAPFLHPSLAHWVRYCQIRAHLSATDDPISRDLRL